MARNEGALARQLDFGDEGVRSVRRTGEGSGAGSPTGAQGAKAGLSTGAQGAKAGLRLAVPSAVLRGPDKYKVLEHRRRQAQIKARKALAAAGTLDFEC